MADKRDNMIEIDAAPDLDELETLKSEFLANTTAPLDGMWLCGFVPLASHFSFRRGSALVGYCCINDEGFLLQFYLRDSEIAEEAPLLANMIAGKYDQLPKIGGAYVSTVEPQYLSHCFDNFRSFEVNAMMYQFDERIQASTVSDKRWTLRLVESEKLSEAVEFVLRDIEFAEDWLTQYFSNLIQRRELYGCWLDGELIGTGENRKSEGVQSGYSDIGVIVGQQQRGKGLGTWIMQQLVQKAIAMSLKPLCSTEHDNIGAQKAIARAGFVPRNRIIQFKV